MNAFVLMGLLVGCALAEVTRTGDSTKDKRTTVSSSYGAGSSGGAAAATSSVASGGVGVGHVGSVGGYAGLPLLSAASYGLHDGGLGAQFGAQLGGGHLGGLSYSFPAAYSGGLGHADLGASYGGFYLPSSAGLSLFMPHAASLDLYSGLYQQPLLLGQAAGGKLAYSQGGGNAVYATHGFPHAYSAAAANSGAPALGYSAGALSSYPQLASSYSGGYSSPSTSASSGAYIAPSSSYGTPSSSYSSPASSYSSPSTSYSSPSSSYSSPSSYSSSGSSYNTLAYSKN